MDVSGGILIQARYGKAAHVRRGRHVKVINTYGSQVLDTWAFNSDDVGEYLSMGHTHSINSRIYPRVGDSLVTNRRRPILTIIEDTSPGIHDTVLCVCNRYVYEELGVGPSHRNCEDNLHEALSELGLKIPSTPSPLNLFMNTPVLVDGSIERLPPQSRPGDHIVMRADMDMVIVFSACPQDITPINGSELTPRDARFEIA
jgi:uncharacterized protein YcgI (DUF1989 family)